jgi:hypothetical protein
VPCLTQRARSGPAGTPKALRRFRYRRRPERMLGPSCMSMTFAVCPPARLYRRATPPHRDLTARRPSTHVSPDMGRRRSATCGWYGGNGSLSGARSKNAPIHRPSSAEKCSRRNRRAARARPEQPDTRGVALRQRGLDLVLPLALDYALSSHGYTPQGKGASE